MKNIKKSALAFMGAGLLFGASCKKDFYTTANNNPNAPKTVTPATLLSPIEGSLAYTQGGDMSRFASLIMQQTYGYSRQSAAYYQYIFTGQDVDQLWGNLYTSVMENDLQLIQQSDAKQYNVYSGIGRVILAYSLQLTVDNWGSAPYSKAFGGASNLQPAYDVDSTLYKVALSLCDSAITFLNNPNPGFLVPGADDAIYGGNAAEWINFAHAIKARLYIHQKGAANAALALNEISQSFQSNADNAFYNGFVASNANANNPWYQFNNQRGDISFVMSTLGASMLTDNDPRYNILIDTTAADGGDYLGAYYGGPGAGVELITYEELQFMQAEAILRTGGSPSAALTAYTNGITASLTKLGVSSTLASAYLASHSSFSPTPMMDICNEENVSLYLNPEAWTMWRRNGFPTLTSQSATAGVGIPVRLLYPQTEYSYNKANTPANSTMYVPKIFWEN
jgi:Starch-binding associating with outer membrane